MNNSFKCFETYYSKRIEQIVGCSSDQAIEIEDGIRGCGNFVALDHLSRAQFERAARSIARTLNIPVLKRVN